MVEAPDRPGRRLAAHRPWTSETLRLTDAHPGVVSTELAATVGCERAAFKLNVRKLKALGLTESLEVGYRLSPRGHVVLRAIDANLAGENG